MKTTSKQSKRYPWIINTAIGSVAIGYPPCCGNGFPESEKESFLIWTGNGYETYGTIKRRGYRYNINEQF